MSEIKTGGPAFPFGVRQENIDTYGCNKPYVTEENEPGMTLRDYFAAKAMQSLLARSTFGIEDDPCDVSSTAYDYADAMIKAREAK